MPLSEYRHRRRVQFYETDAAGIVHFSWYFRYMEEAEHALWRAAGLSIAPPEADIGWPRVSASFDFQRPLRFEEEFDVCIRVAAVTRKTMTYACVLRRDELDIGSGRLVAACARRGPGGALAAIEIPAAVRARLGVGPEPGGAGGAG